MNSLPHHDPETPSVRPPDEHSSAWEEQTTPADRSYNQDARDEHYAHEAKDHEPDPEPYCDYEDDDREHQRMLDDLASDSDDFTRSDEEGWFYSDED